ncbi:uncharacterized protein LOC143240712 isoform X2 [Tachypleus tridentatus]|uniref:uncharacterized protein LOC143240712 isoform X2 n=1 Tax=Tachypleus tridentatus TaxID=6853 RepID=UPI003FD04293
MKWAYRLELAMSNTDYLVRIKEEPSTSRSSVCFVCGKDGVEHSLYSKPRQQGPFFPFLEHHPPPQGASPVGPDGIVSACLLCYSFLTQQWEAYETNRISNSRRMYWLKRFDNEPFAGLEQDKHVEYAVNIFDLGSKTPPTNSLKLDLAEQLPNIMSNVTDSVTDNKVKRSEIDHGIISEDNKALDLSVSVQSSRNSEVRLSAENSNVNVCFVCGDCCSKGSLIDIFTKPISNCPFFPSLAQHRAPLGAKPVDSSGKIEVCKVCHQHLLQQWDLYQRYNVNHTEQNLKVKEATFSGSRAVLQKPVTSRDSSNSSMDQQEFTCFLCGFRNISEEIQVVFSCPTNNKEPYFTFLRKIRPALGASPLSSDGAALICSCCYRKLYCQFQGYERSRVPEEKRLYKITSDAPVELTSVLKLHLTGAFKSVSIPSVSGCYLCGKSMQADKLIFLNTNPQNGAMFFSFIKDLPRPITAKPLDYEGRILVCVECQTLMKTQWETFEAVRMPNEKRQYKIPFTKAVKLESSLTSCGSLHDASPQVSVPQLQISHLDKHACNRNANATQNEVLLTTFNPVSTTRTLPQLTYQDAGFGPSTSSFINKSKYKLEDAATSDKTQLSRRIADPLEGGFTKHPLHFAAVCFVCGEYSSATQTYSLWAHPNQEETAFFPFLFKHMPPNGSEPLKEDSSCFVCTFCYHSLTAQWIAYETSPYPEDSNPWQRQYNTYHYVCFICGITTYRKRTRSISVEDFPFLIEHPRPAGSLAINRGESVITCLTCFESLMFQWKDFERMKVPVELRKYNWIVLPPPPDDDIFQASQETASLRSVASSSEEDTKIIDNVRDISATEELPHGSKTPSLTMHAPPKPGVHTMAAVSPLHPGQHINNMIGHYSGSSNSALNATRTSSFAAALRKLAKQAVDPVAEKDLTSITPASSPVIVSASGTPKHMFSTSYLSSNDPSVSSASPPVITISHTPNQLSHPLETRKRTDLTNMAHFIGNNNSVHSEKRPDSYLGTKDSRAISHLRSESVASVSSHPDDDRPSIRGFQPYKSSSDGSHSHSSRISLYNRHPPALSVSYPYHSAFLPPAYFSHPAYGLKDSPYLDRYGLMRTSMMQLPQGPGLIPRTNVPFVTSRSYPPDLVGHSVGFVSSGINAVSQERVLQEEQHLQEREQEFIQERERDQERVRDWSKTRDQDVQGQCAENLEERNHTSRSPLIMSALRNEESKGKYGSITQGTPRDIVIKRPFQVTVPSSTPLNLTTYLPGSRETLTHHEQDLQTLPEGLAYKHPLFLYQDIHRNSPLHSIQIPREADRTLKKEPEVFKHDSMVGTQDLQSSGIMLLQKTLQDNKGVSPINKANDFEDSTVQNKFSSTTNQNGINKRAIIGLKESVKHRTRYLSTALNNNIKMGENSNFSGNDKRNIFSDESHKSGGLKQLNTSNYNHYLPPIPLSSVSQSSKSERMCGVIIDNSSSSSHGSLEHAGTETTDIVCSTLSKVVSKLDIEEERLKKARLSENYCSDDCDSDAEEENQSRLRYDLVIKSGPPLKLDLDPRKLEFLETLGLCTHQKRKEKELDRFLKCKNLIHQHIIIPTLKEHQRCTSPLDEVRSSFNPKNLCREDDYPQKVEFLTVLDLMPTSLQKIQEIENTWKAIKSERTKRKRKYSEREDKKKYIAIVSVQESVRTVSNRLEEDRKQPIKLILEDPPLLSKQQNEDVHIPSTVLNSPDMKETEKEVIPKAQQTKLFSVNHKDQPSNVPLEASNKSVLNTPVSVIPWYEGRRLERDFVQEFHESVFQTTELQLAEQKPSQATDQYSQHNTSLNENSLVTFANKNLVNRESKVLERSKVRKNESYSWPGIEAVLEAYEHHLAEQKSEKEFLLQRCQQLGLKNQELNNQVDRFHQQVNELFQLKHLLDEDRQRYQKAIDELKMCLYQLR